MDLSTLDKLWKSKELEEEWNKLSVLYDEFEIPTRMGEANPGDRRALYYITKGLDITKVLEVGTFIGSSTVSIALGLKGKEGAELITVDIFKVNDESTRVWAKYKQVERPKYLAGELIHKVECQSFVKFINVNATVFMRRNDNKYDLIFLDGPHDFHNVYRILPLAVNQLSKEGIILLHGFKSESERATNKLIKEGLNILVYPIKVLPWETKAKDKYNTSLCLIMVGE